MRLIGPILVLGVIVVAVLTGLAAAAVSRAEDADGARTETRSERRTPPTPMPDAGVRSPDPMPVGIDALIVGGGPAPDANEVEIEETVALATELLGERAVVLFAGGADTRSVQVRSEDPDESASLRTALGDLLTPRNGRDAHYRATTLPRVHGPSTITTLREILADAIATPTDVPLTLALIGHGAGGEGPLETSFLLWTGEPLDALTLSDLLAPAERPVRMIVTSCYAGGLAELAFEGADPSLGPALTDRCGVFATRWDREASGCDPDPARGARDGYTHHLLRALSGQDAEGEPLEPIDLNGDGRITLLEAHASARITSRSIDVPTTTSSRLLRAIAPSEGPSERASLPDEEAVVEALTHALGDDGATQMEARIAEIEASRAEATASLETLTEEADAAWVVLTGALLSRWPVLDDPFHPDFDATLADEGEAIDTMLATSPDSEALEVTTQRIDALEARIDALELELALLYRWEEARETIALAERLRAVGGPAWERYLQMRACEDGAL